MQAMKDWHKSHPHLFVKSPRNHTGRDIYALGVLMAVIPAVMARGATRVGFGFGRGLIAISVLWCLSAPIFFFMPTEFDGVYERYLGLITFALIGLLARLFFLFSKSNV
jgi:hypothetical protein